MLQSSILQYVIYLAMHNNNHYIQLFYHYSSTYNLLINSDNLWPKICNNVLDMSLNMSVDIIPWE